MIDWSVKVLAGAPTLAAVLEATNCGLVHVIGPHAAGVRLHVLPVSPSVIATYDPDGEPLREVDPSSVSSSDWATGYVLALRGAEAAIDVTLSNHGVDGIWLTVVASVLRTPESYALGIICAATAGMLLEAPLTDDSGHLGLGSEVDPAALLEMLEIDYLAVSSASEALMAALKKTSLASAAE
jgi:hypothetical protein